MTKREWIEKVYRGEHTDKVPVGFWFHFLPDEKLYSGMTEPELLPQNYAGHKKYIEEFDPDFVKIMTDGLFTRPYDTMPAVEKAADLYSFEPMPHDHPYFAESVKLAKTVREYAGPDRVMLYNVFSPLFNLSHITETSQLEDIYEWIKEDPAAVKHALDVIGADMSYLTQLVMSEGTADGIYYSVNDYRRVIPMETYAKVVMPSDLAPLIVANTMSNFQTLHICGYHGCVNYLRLYQNYPVAAVNWAVHVEGVDLAKGREIFKDKCIIGGFDQMPGGLIEVGSKEEIRQFTRELMEQIPHEGFIVGADCTVPPATPLEHLNWVREIVNEY